MDVIVWAPLGTDVSVVSTGRDSRPRDLDLATSRT